MKNQEVKGTLAKLLATENLNVEHRSVSTAYFDVERRVLCLPIWKDMSETVYDLLVGHEVGHALYTPTDYLEASEGVPQDILNVLEDVRIEKLMKRTYPGLTKSFFKGYREMDENNFFELQGKDLAKMAFIDRVNVHYKVGLVGSTTSVSFSEAETILMEKAKTTETFEDVVALCHEYVEHIDKNKMEQPPTSDLPAGSSSQNDRGEQQVGPMSESQNETQVSEEEKEEEVPTSESFEQGSEGSDSGDEYTSETYRNMEERAKELIDENARDFEYVDLPSIDLDNYIVSYKDIADCFDRWAEKVEEHKMFGERIEHQRNRYTKYKRSSIKTVNYLAKEFECKKAADQYARANTSRTGVLDTSKLHTYKFNEDIFKKVTTIPDGKNHGLIFFLDWSGSMSNTLNGTMRQLFDLVWFCKKVSIPFRVYAFSNFHGNDQYFPKQEESRQTGKLAIDNSFRLLEFLSSKMNAKTLDKQMRDLYMLSMGDFGPHQLSLSGTPLVETIVCTREVLAKFRNEEKVQKANVVYLTDGEAAYPHYYKHIKYLDGIYDQPMNNNSLNYVIRDPKTKYSKVMNFWGSVTNQFIDYVQHLVDCNIVGFRLCTKSEISKEARHADLPVEPLEKEWRKNKCVAIKSVGFNELYLMQINDSNQEARTRYYWDPKQSLQSDSIIVNKDASNAQLTKAFKKHMNEKMINKMILSKFAGQIA